MKQRKEQGDKSIMDNFVIKGKAKTVFRLVEMIAKAEQAEKKASKKK